MHSRPVGGMARGLFALRGGGVIAGVETLHHLGRDVELGLEVHAGLAEKDGVVALHGVVAVDEVHDGVVEALADLKIGVGEALLLGVEVALGLLAFLLELVDVGLHRFLREVCAVLLALADFVGHGLEFALLRLVPLLELVHLALLLLEEVLGKDVGAEN